MKLLPAFALLALFLFSGLAGFAQELNYAGSRHQSLAGATVCLTDCWSVFANQAGLAELHNPEIAGSFQNRFLVNELSTRLGLFVLPVQSSVFAVSIVQFGKIPFRQEKFGLAYARQIRPNFNVGLQFNYYSLFLSEENRSVSSAGLELGFQYVCAGRLMLGAHLLNPYQTGIKLMSGKFNFPTRLTFGLFYQLSDSFSISSEFENDFRKLIILKCGMEYRILEILFLRAGIAGKPNQFSAGMGFHLKKITMDLATSYNQFIGNSPSVSFQYQF